MGDELMKLLNVGLLATSFALQGCVSTSLIKGPDNGGEHSANAATVRVFFATDRKRTLSAVPSDVFGIEEGRLNYGYCEVSIPRDHRMGALETPSILRLEFSPDPVKHVVLLSTTTITEDDFLGDVRSKAKSESGSKVLLFVHGYNVTFADAARRTAQLAYDLAFNGAPVFYSWPSVGTVAGYTADQRNIDWSLANFTAFLEDFLDHTGADKVYLIGHSLGTKELTQGLEAVIAKRADLAPRLAAIILAAPDIDAEIFQRDIAPALAGTHAQVTVYASSDDRALVASRAVAGGHRRVGDLADGVLLTAGIETIDATSADTDLLGHSYFADQRTMLADIYQIVHSGFSANQRFGLIPVDSNVGRYWRIQR
jgi:esterase/lipase superfamily enzyme